MMEAATANTISSDYEAKMLEAFINKPEKYLWYENAFRKYNVNGVEKMAWNWSWWAFFGGLFYLLYRKAYLAALGLFVPSVLVTFIPFGGLIIWIAAGGLLPYLVYRTYRSMKREIEASIDSEQKRLETMRAVGGCNTWAAWAGIIIMGFSFAVVFVMAGTLPELR